MTVGDIVADPLASRPGLPGQGRRASREMMANTGLSPQMINRYPHEFSGGQPTHRYRAGDDPRPRLIVCDEPVSALDVSIQAQIVNLLMRLQASSACR